MRLTKNAKFFWVQGVQPLHRLTLFSTPNLKMKVYTSSAPPPAGKILATLTMDHEVHRDKCCTATGRDGKDPAGVDGRTDGHSGGSSPCEQDRTAHKQCTVPGRVSVRISDLAPTGRPATLPRALITSRKYGPSTTARYFVSFLRSFQ